MGLSSRGARTPSRTLDVLGLVAMALFIVGPLLAWLRIVPAAGADSSSSRSAGSLALDRRPSWPASARCAAGASAGAARSPRRSRRSCSSGARRTAAGGPLINDFTTDPADPPAFKQAAAEPANAGRDMSYPAGVRRAAARRAAPTSHRSVLPAAAGAPPSTRVEAVATAMPTLARDAHAIRRRASWRPSRRARSSASRTTSCIRVRPDPARAARGRHALQVARRQGRHGRQRRAHPRIPRRAATRTARRSEARALGLVVVLALVALGVRLRSAAARASRTGRRRRSCRRPRSSGWPTSTTRPATSPSRPTGASSSRYHPDGDPPEAVMTLRDGKPVPFPSPGFADFDTVLSMRIDRQGRLWTLDHAPLRSRPAAAARLRPRDRAGGPPLRLPVRRRAACSRC